MALPAALDDPPADRRELPDRKAAPPVILISQPGLANLIIIEGHKRPTVILACRQLLPAELEVLPGITIRHDK